MIGNNYPVYPFNGADDKLNNRTRAHWAIFSVQTTRSVRTSDQISETAICLNTPPSSPYAKILPVRANPPSHRMFAHANIYSSAVGCINMGANIKRTLEKSKVFRVSCSKRTTDKSRGSWGFIMVCLREEIV